jgi:uncharacterized membrane protein YdjX (TVP38/TMEM64 family)
MQNYKKTVIRFLVLILFLGGGYLFLHLSGAFHYLKPAELKAWVASFGWWAPLIYMGIYAFLPLLLFPGTILTLVGGLLFGPYLGTLYTIIGSSASAAMAYIIANKLGKEFVAARLKGRFRELYLQSEKGGFKIIFLLRIVPLFPFDVINYAAGLSPIRFRHYLAGTVLGMAPGTFIYNLLGSTIIDFHSPKFMIALGLLMLSIFLPLLYWKRMRKNV